MDRRADNVSGSSIHERSRENGEIALLVASLRHLMDVQFADALRQVPNSGLVQVRALLDSLESASSVIASPKGSVGIRGSWISANISNLSQIAQAQTQLSNLADTILFELCAITGAMHGEFYFSASATADPEDWRKLVSLAQFSNGRIIPGNDMQRIGQGFVGQAAKCKKRLYLYDLADDVSDGGSTGGFQETKSMVAVPILHSGELLAVIKLASRRNFTNIELCLLDLVPTALGAIISKIVANAKTQEHLQESLEMAQELRQTNAELVAQAKELRASEARIRQQKEELQHLNDQLRKKSKTLAKEKRKIARKNAEIQTANETLEKQTHLLAAASQYKSEFLANMSHEIRTPLNSLMVLSDTLQRNNTGNLTEKQIEVARTIHGSGAELLELINEILDLAQIESGKMLVVRGRVVLPEVLEWARNGYQQTASNSNIAFSLGIDSDLPKVFESDEKRIRQVIKNFLSNAFKFTDTGEVSVNIGSATSGWDPRVTSLNDASYVIAISVRDTGIGIAKENFERVFEAFHQADGTTNRRFGGTGLGLSISKEIAAILGGDISLTSKVGEGSTFTLYLPDKLPQYIEDFVGSLHLPATVQSRPSDVVESNAQGANDARPADAHAQTPLLLDCDSDVGRFKFLFEDEKFSSWKYVHADHVVPSMVFSSRATSVVVIGSQITPEGWAAIGWIKNSPEFAHIRVLVVSSSADRPRAEEIGADLFAERHSSEPELREFLLRFARQSGLSAPLLVIGKPDENLINSLRLLDLKGDAIEVVDSLDEISAGLATKSYAGAIVTLRSTVVAADVFDLLAHGRDFGVLPLFADKALISNKQARQAARALGVKTGGTQAELLRFLSLCLGIPRGSMSAETCLLLPESKYSSASLDGKSILIVDDDFRNIFTLNLVFEASGCSVIYAESASAALEKLATHPGVDLVLMDVMMPDMDGNEAIKEIRKNTKLDDLAIIALTAKATPEDKQASLDAGANAYVSKPFDTTYLLALAEACMNATDRHAKSRDSQARTSPATA